MICNQSSRAEAFQGLHERDTPLILPNAWDAGSARLMEHIGCEAVATTSAGVAWAHGYQDGDQIPVGLLATAVENMTRVIAVPLSVDIESGYSETPAEVASTVTRVMDAGAVGINIEDGSGSPALLCRKIEATRRAAERAGVSLFINARTDVFLRGLVAEPERSLEVIRRAELFRAAGADGIFVPLLADTASIRAIAAESGLPLNVMACPGLPPVAELGPLGVRRLSAGAAIAEAVFASVKELAATFLRDGDSDVATAGGMPFPDVNALFA